MKFYITTAIDYVNAKPHIGHAYEKILADAIARWYRLKDVDTFFLTGTDEQAQKNEQAAKEAGIPVKKFVDQNVSKFKELIEKLNISNDYFIRTTEDRHVKFSKLIFQKLYDKGLIYKAVYKGLYCIGCEEYKTEKDLVDNKCPEHKKKPEYRNEENYFFKMSKFQKDIIKLVSRKGFIVPEERRNEILSRLKKDGLKDLCVSRKGLNWGIKTPIDPNQTIYVWMDALLNYVSALDYPNGKLYKKFWPADVHLIGKGINWFHSVIWPSLLLAADIPVPKSIYVHGYLTVNSQKISKSLGNVLDPIELVNKFSVDPLRYFFLREIPFGDDGDFSEEALVARINGELVSDLGNLLYRVLTLVEKFKLKIEGKDEISKKLNLKKAEKCIENFEFNNYVEEIWKFIRYMNKYMNDKEPWKLEGKKLGNVLYNLVEGLRIVSILISPLMPDTSKKINKQLGVKEGKLKDCKFGEFSGKPKKGRYLFEKVELKEKKFLLDLRVAEIKEVKDHPDADKLYVLKVDCGEKRQIVAGLKEYYSKDELNGRKIVIVKNLKPAKLRGIESQGMLLAGQSFRKGPNPKNVVGLLSPKKSKIGDSVLPEGYKADTKQITYNNFSKLDLKVKNSKAYFEDKELKTKYETISVDKVKEGKIR